MQFAPTEKWKEAEQKTLFYHDTCPRKLQKKYTIFPVENCILYMEQSANDTGMF
jgi:hypothetical protein